ncbi:hypothetical protein Poli38472_010149 [Pythium oligandrum]|uniref:Glutathione S-transferase n=1 Tax=Pythium oligandrum TaxID=41045 RepID=A0A8K1FCR0_PYTOL|nr:hypothetical protein Poli38472_010149 [Pythium oligandrum]|eukprot:TMW58590.1 hypothetical protein Poli38472_010149 [Pythium oligandrum]
MTQPLKVSYFDSTGRAEITRLTLAAAGISFEDDRVKDFATLKPTLPLGQLPVLTIDGTVYPQSMAIARYAARIGGFYPSDPLEMLKVEMTFETLLELTGVIIDAMFLTADEKLKAEKTEAVKTTKLPLVLGFVESKIEGKLLLGDKLSLADLYLFDVYTNVLLLFAPDIDLKAYPKVAGIIEHVKTLPRVAEYLAKTAGAVAKKI